MKTKTNEEIGNLCPDCGEILQRNSRTQDLSGSTGLGTFYDVQTCPHCFQDWTNVYNAHRDSNNEFLYSLVN